MYTCLPPKTVEVTSLKKKKLKKKSLLWVIKFKIAR